jgi:hypothetical protein
MVQESGGSALGNHPGVCIQTGANARKASVFLVGAPSQLGAGRWTAGNFTRHFLSDNAIISRLLGMIA